MELSQEHPARLAVIQALIPAAETYPNLLPLRPAFDGLDKRDRRLATAIFRLVLQRWGTLEHLVNGCLSRPLEELEPALQTILLSGAAQLLFMDRQPAYAVVDASVDLATGLLRPGAGKMANAVLRRVADMVVSRDPHGSWTPDQLDRLPLDVQGTIQLSEPWLADDADWASRVAVATSHPRPLVQRWAERWGEEKVLAIGLHSLMTPPTMLADAQGFRVWQEQETGEGGLSDYLAKHPDCRVQDRTSSAVVEATKGLMSPKLILDFCAGRGTKARQAAQMYPDAMLLATDPDEERFADLAKSLSGFARARAVPAMNLKKELGRRQVDLLMLDVPCSNSGVLARRPEARYRLSGSLLEELVQLQRRILLDSVRLVARGGFVLYSTCSLEDEENIEQSRWIARSFKAQLLRERMTWPSHALGCDGQETGQEIGKEGEKGGGKEGGGGGYQDGGYYALFQWP